MSIMTDNEASREMAIRDMEKHGIRQCEDCHEPFALASGFIRVVDGDYVCKNCLPDCSLHQDQPLNDNGDCPRCREEEIRGCITHCMGGDE
jgi:hypothetical protein